MSRRLGDRPATARDELFDLPAVGRVHAHERPQGLHVGVDRELALAEQVLHGGSHLDQQPAAHRHPGFAAAKLGGDVRDAHLMGVDKQLDEASLFKRVE